MKTLFKDLAVGDYFRSVYTGALFVKNDKDEGTALDLNGERRQPHWFEFDPDTEVLQLDEGDWPTINYVPQVREEWKWDRIEKAVMLNFMLNDDGSEEPYGTAFLGTTLGIMPSGKIYAMWTTNQTAEDVNRDRAYIEALEIVAAEHNLFLDWNDSNDLFLSRAVTFEEIAKIKGYSLVQHGHARGHDYQWVKDDEKSSIYFEQEDDAWKDCCLTNKLVGD